MTMEEQISQLGTESPAIERLQIPAYAYWSEAAHGIAWAGRATVFPASIGIGATFDTEAAHRVGRTIGIEGRAKHNMYMNASKSKSSPDFFGLTFFAPNINIVRDVRWGRGQETYGEDPTLTSGLAAAVIAGMQWSNGTTYPLVAATAKHFFAYNFEGNEPDGGSDPQYRLRANVNVSAQDLYHTYLPPFRSAVSVAGARSVMCSYNAVNGIPACAHPLLQKQLREIQNFSGYIVSDCGAIVWMGPTKHNYTADDTHSAAAGLNAGCDLDCGRVYQLNAAAAVSQGLVNTSTVRSALAAVLVQRVELGMLDPPAAVPWHGLGAKDVDCPEHRSLAREVATKSIVLLKNEANILPLNLSSLTSLAVIGPNANRTDVLLSNYPGCKSKPGGGIDPNCTLVNVLQGLSAQAQAANVSVAYERGCDIDTDDGSGIPAAVAAAAAADAVVVVAGLITCQETGDQCQEAEAKDRTSIALPGKQRELILKVAAAGKPIVLVVLSGSTVAIPSEAAAAGAVLFAWYPGEEGGNAVADIVFGSHNPSGRLPETVFSSLEQLPAHYTSVAMTDKPGRTHRYLLPAVVPLFPFGFGLSYGERSYSQAAVSPAAVPNTPHATVEVSVVLSYSEEQPGEEVVQVYSSYQDTGRLKSSPLQQLQLFKRVSLSAAPESVAETRGISSSVSREVVVRFTLPVSALAVMNDQEEVVVLAGKYKIWVGGTSPAPGSAPSAATPRGQQVTLTVFDQDQ